jgi:Tfp pilus assembly pilus retraction ATPase PilT
MTMSNEQSAGDRTKFGHEPELNKLFRAAIKNRASDLHLKVGQPLKLRLFGKLKNTTGEIMTAERMEQLAFEILTSNWHSRYSHRSRKRLSSNTARWTSHTRLTGSIVFERTYSASGA